MAAGDAADDAEAWAVTRHADAALTVLLDLAESRYPAIREAVVAYSMAHNRLMGKDDLVDGLREFVQLLMATEQLRDLVKAMADDARNKLAEVMDETGAGRIDTEHHTASISRRIGRVTVTNEGDLPAVYWTQSKPVPDKDLIGRALKNQVPVPGAMLLDNGSPTLTLRSKK